MHFSTIIKGSVSVLCLIELHVMSHVAAILFNFGWNSTCKLASRVLDWDDGHWTTFPCGLQRAQVRMVRLGGWITQLSHPRSDRQKKGCCVSVYVSWLGCARTPQHTCHEDLRGQRATLQACAVSTRRWRSEVVDHRNWKDKVKGELGCLVRACGENVESAGWNCLQGPRHCEPCYWRFSSNAFWQDPARRQATVARSASWVHWGGSSGWTAKAHAGTWTPHSITVIQMTLKTLQWPEVSV